MSAFDVTTATARLGLLADACWSWVMEKQPRNGSAGDKNRLGHLPTK
jgi:hypothetical protein